MHPSLLLPTGPALRRDILADSGMSPEAFDAEFRVLRNDRYLSRSTTMTATEWIVGIAKQSLGEPVVGGMAAQVMHGSVWYDDDFTIELIRDPTASGRPARGTITHRIELSESEVVEMAGILVTSVIRTAFDIGREGPPWRALGRLDALQRATGFDPAELAAYTKEKKGSRGIRQLRRLIPLIDGTAESPPESWVRLLMHDGGLPTPELQVTVYNTYGVAFARIDLAYEEHRIGIEYDGAYHNSPEQRIADAAREQTLVAELDWIMIHVDKDRMRDKPIGVLTEIRQALHTRGVYF